MDANRRQIRNSRKYRIFMQIIEEWYDCLETINNGRCLSNMLWWESYLKQSDDTWAKEAWPLSWGLSYKYDSC